MLHAFLAKNRSELIDRCRQKVAKRTPDDHVKLDHGIPQFLDQLTQTLYSDETSNRAESVKVSGPSDGGLSSTTSEIHATARKHVQELRDQGFSIGRVVHDYGDLCQAVTELAIERNTSISAREFGTLNRCLDNAIAQAVTAYVGQGGADSPPDASASLDKRLASLGKDMRNSLNSLVLALDLIKQGAEGIGVTLLNSNLALMCHLIDHTLAQIRTPAGHPPG
jgi:hypothetical protein